MPTPHNNNQLQDRVTSFVTQTLPVIRNVSDSSTDSSTAASAIGMIAANLDSYLTSQENNDVPASERSRMRRRLSDDIVRLQYLDARLRSSLYAQTQQLNAVSQSISRLDPEAYLSSSLLASPTVNEGQNRNAMPTPRQRKENALRDIFGLLNLEDIDLNTLRQWVSFAAVADTSTIPAEVLNEPEFRLMRNGVQILMEGA